MTIISGGRGQTPRIGIRTTDPQALFHIQSDKKADFPALMLGSRRYFTDGEKVIQPRNGGYGFGENSRM